MKQKIIIIIIDFLLPLAIIAQSPDTINRTDTNGNKQGYWIKKYPDGSTQYEGYFIDNQPAGIFKRYYENDTLQTILFYSKDGDEADVIFFHNNGYIASTGKYINRKKEGKWSFYSSTINEYLVLEENYRNNLREGLSVRYYPNKTVAEEIWYKENIRHGEWIQYYPNGEILLKANYVNGILEGPFEIRYKDGKIHYMGFYKNDRREGIWYVYNPDGTLKNEIKYIAGMAVNPEIYRKENDYLDSLEIEGKKLNDPKKTGTIW
ncbi:MAG: toxin-antitoxin system YwqK family antitoxin [Bacteroidales bacterium]|nr:toxin-antitoxin system YwqK family antitoxin [Bacteroidales bacterium]